MRAVQRFLWLAGGFDEDILLRSECRSVRSKYSSIGGLIVMTAVLAMCSGGYAIYTVFQGNPIVVPPFAVLWGTFILLLDRYLLSSTRKLARVRDFFSTLEMTPPFASPPSSLTNFSNLLLRLGLAIAIGIVVAKPIEMRILMPWVREQLLATATQTAAASRASLASESSTLDAQTKLVADKQALLADLNKKKAVEMTGDHRGNGPIARAIQEQIDSTTIALARMETDLEAMRARQRTRLDEIQSTLEADRRLANANTPSIVTGIQKIDELKAPGGSRGALVRAVSFFISLLFVLIEIMPIMSKAIAPFDIYDALLLKEEHGSILAALSSARASHQQAVSKGRWRRS